MSRKFVTPEIMLTWCWFCSLSLWTQNPSDFPPQPGHWQPVLLLQQLTSLITCCKSKWGSATAWTSLSAIPGYRLEDNDFDMPCVEKLWYANKKKLCFPPQSHSATEVEVELPPHVCVREYFCLNKAIITHTVPMTGHLNWSVHVTDMHT